MLREELFSGELALALRGLGPRVKIIMAGDWNCVLEARDVERDFGLKSSDSLAAIVSNFDMSDVFTYLHPRRQEFTYQRASVSRSRLDRVYVSAGLLPKILRLSHEPGLSDHSVVVADLQLKREQEGGGARGTQNQQGDAGPTRVPVLEYGGSTAPSFRTRCFRHWPKECGRKWGKSKEHMMI